MRATDFARIQSLLNQVRLVTGTASIKPEDIAMALNPRELAELDILMSDLSGEIHQAQEMSSTE